MDLLAIKLLCAAALGILAIVFGLAPLLCLRSFIRHPNRSRAVLGFASCVAGGVFLGVCLLDLLPDVQQSLSKGLASINVQTHMPLAELLMAIGLFIILIVEQAVALGSPDASNMIHGHEHADAHDHHGHSHNNSHGHSHAHTPAQPSPLVMEDGGPRLDVFSPRAVQSPRPRITVDDTAVLTKSGQFARSSPPVLLARESDPLLSPRPRSLQRTPSVQSLPADLGLLNMQEIAKEVGLPVFERPFRAIILLVALSIHSLFEGLSLGAASDTASTLQLVLALAIHKPLESMGISLSLVKSARGASFVVMMVAIFSLMTPIGIGIGAAIVSAVDAGLGDLIGGILQGLAGGSFLYVVFIEVLPHEFVTDENEEHEILPPQVHPSAENVRRRASNVKLLKLLGLLLGFAVITATKFIPEGDEDTGPGSC